MKNMLKFFIMGIVALVLFISSCDKKTDDAKESGDLIVKLTNNSVNDTSLNVDLKLVKAECNLNGAAEVVWKSLTTKDSIYNMSELQNGNSILIAQEALEVGKISQLILLFGENNTLIAANDTFDIEIPIEYSNGIIIPVNDSIVANDVLYITLNFNSAASVIDKGDGVFSLVPVITVMGDN